MNSTVIHQLAELCSAKGIEHVILCPGSRSAPLTLAFLRNNRFNCWTFSDERSAAFIGMAMAQQTGKPVVLVCTSGSAAYNFAPAVAEAFFQKIPLVVITADRPKEWIDQLDGQTIRQQGIYGDHVKQSFELPQEYPHDDAIWHTNRIANEAINLAAREPMGPVHINAPFREPLYSGAQERNPAHNPPRKIDLLPIKYALEENQWSEIVSSINQFQKILIVPGQCPPDPRLGNTLRTLHDQQGWPIAGDVLSNLHGLPAFCSHADTFLGQVPEKQKHSLAPDLLITFGQSLVAKNLKLFLRKHPPRQHWHIQAAGNSPDTFQNLTRIIPVKPDYFFSGLTTRIEKRPKNAYTEQWALQEEVSRNAIKDFFKKHEQGEFSLVQKVMAELPENCNLHLANSMSVRYANHIGLGENQKGVKVYGNRGTSGIDGCSSTAVGHALTSTVPNILITGDQAFFYDRNAFWHNYPIPNLFVVVLNNHGGIIFNMIDGPDGLPEAEEFFITRQTLKAKPLANEFGFSYIEAQSASIKEFFKPDGNVKILEIESSQSLNKSVFESFKKQIKKNYEA